MPMIRRYDVPQVGQTPEEYPTVPESAATLVPEAISKAGQQIAGEGVKWATAISQAEDAAQVANASAAASIKIQDLRNQTISSPLFNTDPVTARQEWNQKVATLGSELAASIPSPKARALFQNTFVRTAAAHTAAMSDDVNRKRVEIVKGTGIASIRSFADAAASAPTPETMQAQFDHADMVIDGLVAGGAISMEDRDTLRRSTRDQAYSTRITTLANSDPILAQQVLNREAPKMSPAVAERLAAHLKPLVDARTTRSIADNVLSGKPLVLPSNQIGGLAAHFESGAAGSAAVGYDPQGGTSYGTYQLASRPGSMDAFVKYLDSTAPEYAKVLREAGPANTGSRKGAMPDAWKKLSVEQGEKFSALQQDFIQKSYYEPTVQGLQGVFDVTKQPRAVQEAVWSAAIQQGPGSAVKLIQKAWTGATDKDGNTNTRKFLEDLYAERATRFGSSPPEIQASVRARLQRESQLAVGLLNENAAPPNMKDIQSNYTAYEDQVRAQAEMLRPGDPVYRDSAVSQFRQQVADVATAQKMQEQGNTDLLVQALVGSNGVKTMEELLSDPKRAAAYSAIYQTAPEKIPHFESMLEHNSKGKDVPETPETAALWYKLSGQASNDPDAFTSLDLNQYYTRLPRAHWNSLVATQNAINKKDVQEQERQINIRKSMLALGNDLKAMGYRPTSKKEKDMEKVAEFEGRFAEALNNHRETTGKRPGPEDSLAIGKRLLTQGRVQGTGYIWEDTTNLAGATEQGKEGIWYVPEKLIPTNKKAGMVAEWTREYGAAPTSTELSLWATTEAKADQIPLKDRELITASFKANRGKEPTSSQIARIYIRKQLDDARAKQAVPAAKPVQTSVKKPVPKTSAQETVDAVNKLFEGFGENAQ